ncbi:MAG: homoserine dehydrogenase [Clostridiales bacterium]|nr:homoserine dehydrogenase [Clostridiales bacterium]
MLNIAILGFGVVGSGVAEVIAMNSDTIERHLGEKLNVKKILDLRDFPDSPFASLVTHEASEVFDDPEITVVVETIGGARIAYEYTKRALSAGKSVVTSNKELVATHGPELMEIAKENGCLYLYEAAVGGGIPIIRPLHRCMAANKIVRIAGIVNGTTNYILTNMRVAGITYDEALAQAQAKGYAEQNPTADVEGIDAQRKLSILSSIAMEGQYVSPEEISTEGISKITLEDIDLAYKIGCSCKLLAVFDNRGGDKPFVFVAPHFVRNTSVLYPVEDVFNAIMVEGNALGEAMFYGRGAGKLPTASAVVGDILEAVMPPEDNAYNHSWFSFPDVGRVTAEYEDIVTGAVAKGAPGDLDILFDTFKAYETEKACDDNECSAIFIKKISHREIEKLIKNVTGGTWIHYME